MSLRRRLSEQLTGWAYQLGWKLICRLPESWARRAFTAVADVAWRRQGPKVQVLEANLRRVLSWKQGSPEVDGQELRALSRAALRSYARYWLEVFRLPVIPVERIVSGMHIEPVGEAAMFANLQAGRGVVLALPHMGNFEQAGGWVVARGAGTFTTVAERLRPESVYEAFVAFREGLGMEVLPLTGSQSPFGVLAQRLRAGGLVCLVSDRDLKESGVEVEMFGEKARIAADRRPRGAHRRRADAGGDLVRGRGLGRAHLPGDPGPRLGHPGGEGRGHEPAAGPGLRGGHRRAPAGLAHAPACLHRGP